MICETGQSELPFVSVLLPVRNEQDYISACLDSIYSNTWPRDRFEVLAIDGRSADDTAGIISRYRKSHPNLQMLTNESQTVPHALNLGIARSRGEILMWLCGHAVYSENYIERSIELLRETGAASVGGLVIPRGRGTTGRVIAAALKSPLGNGNAVYRTGKKTGWVDTVMCGCWLRTSVEKAGGFDEHWVRNQDSKFNARLRETVGNIYFDPSMHCYHHVRESFTALARQYFEYGFWRFRTMLAHPASIKARQLAAPVFVMVLFCLAISSLKLFSLVLGLYFAVLCLEALRNKALSGIREKILLPPAFAVIHFSWAAGFLWSALSWTVKLFTGRARP